MLKYKLSDGIFVPHSAPLLGRSVAIMLRIQGLEAVLI